MKVGPIRKDRMKKKDQDVIEIISGPGIGVRAFNKSGELVPHERPRRRQQHWKLRYLRPGQSCVVNADELYEPVTPEAIEYVKTHPEKLANLWERMFGAKAK